MRLQLKNIGKLAEADVELKGITVIGGENDTGKSTVGKVLFSVFNGFYDVENRVANDCKNSIARVLRNLHDLSGSSLTEPLKKACTDIYAQSFVSKTTDISVETMIFQLYPNATAEEIQYTSDRIKSILSLPSEYIIKQLMQGILGREFDGQICKMPFQEKQSKIKLTIQQNASALSLIADSIVDIEFPMVLNTEAIYIDDPFVLDSLNNTAYLHRAHLASKLMEQKEQDNIVESAILNEKMNCILERINLVCGGRIKQTGPELFYQLPDNSATLSMKNVSTGIKMFAIIKRLIENGALGFNSTLILDEPEIHVHPKWQLVFAEIIVLLQKEFDMHILLNTHSPYFLEAIEVYSKKHGIEEKCRYYLSENTEDGAVIKDVTDRTGKIYKKLAEPFQTLENVRYEDA